MKGLILVCALCLLVSGCASWEMRDGFVRYERADHVGDIIGKTVGNVLIATGYVFYFTAHVAALCGASWVSVGHSYDWTDPPQYRYSASPLWTDP